MSSRVLISFSAILLLSLCAWRWPRVKTQQNIYLRWFNHLALTVISFFLIKILVPFQLAALAQQTSEKGIGLFNFVDWPLWLEVLLGVIFFDCLIYWQHRLFHVVPVLWRLHRLHHSDDLMETSTAFRFHPIEIILSLFIKIGGVFLFGARIETIIAFEILLNTTAMFNHSNLLLSRGLERLLKYVLVTPDFHYVHHSTVKSETNSHYGFCLPWWDYLFGSYRKESYENLDRVVIGLDEFKGKEIHRLDHLVIQPFVKIDSKN